MGIITEHFFVEERVSANIIHLVSADRTNRLSRDCVQALTEVVKNLSCDPKPLIISGNDEFFSAGADLREIRALTGKSAYEFSAMGRCLMDGIDTFPAIVIAAIRGYCMGGGLDLALACDLRLANSRAIFGHRGAALGLITGWGGTQRLPRLIGRVRALQMFLGAEKLSANRALEWGLIQEISSDPLASALELVEMASKSGRTTVPPECCVSGRSDE